MKQIILLISLISFTLYSCSDLEVDPNSQLSSNQAYKTPKEFEYGLSGVYMDLQVWIESIYKAGSESSDEMLTPNRGGDWMGDMQLIYKHTWDANTNELLGLYNQYSILIADANDLIGKVDASPLKENAIVKGVKSDARFLRAFAYFMMMDMWGNVPLKLDPIYNHKNPPKQNTRAEIYGFLDTELRQLATTDLPTNAPYGRANRNSAKALLAKMYLNAEVYLGAGQTKWDRVVTLTDEIKASNQCVLENNFKAVFAWDNFKSKEIIFSVVCDSRFTGFTGAYVENYSYLYSINNLTAKYGPTANGWGGSAVPPDFFRTFEVDDIRRNMFIFGPQFAADGVTPIIARADTKVDDSYERQLNYYVDFINSKDPIDDADHWDGARACKYLMEGINGDMPNRGLNNDIPILRYADVLMMRAEALYRLDNGSTEALALVNEVRTRNGHNPIAGFTALTADNLLAERGREFAWEGWRRNDLIRFGKFGAAKFAVPAKDQPHLNLFPIPQVIRNANPNLEQNPGY